MRRKLWDQYMNEFRTEARVIRPTNRGCREKRQTMPRHKVAEDRGREGKKGGVEKENSGKRGGGGEGILPKRENTQGKEGTGEKRWIGRALRSREKCED